MAAMDRVLNMESKRILVTGGGVFRLSPLSRLVDQGHDVICLDNLYTGSKRNIATLLGRPNLIVRHDVTFPIYLEVDQIYNLCPASPIHYQRTQYKPLRPVFTARLTCWAC